MTTGTTPRSPLEGLISCGRCGVPMQFEEQIKGDQPRYACKQYHEEPFYFPAHTADHTILRDVLAACLTDWAISNLQSAFADLLQQKNPDITVSREDFIPLREEPDFFLQSVGTNEKARNFLAMFITQIELHPDRATVHYSIPLPRDSHLPGATEQEVLFSNDPTP